MSLEYRQLDNDDSRREFAEAAWDQADDMPDGAFHQFMTDMIGEDWGQELVRLGIAVMKPLDKEHP